MHNWIRSQFTIISISLLISTTASPDTSQVTAQDDTVKAGHVTLPPIIDGADDDVCWQNAKWQAIDQVWIPYGGHVTNDDYSGHYKVAWSSAENVLYFLVEITDDVFVNGYVYNSNPGVGGGYPDYDIVEVFIDENKSGGLHVFDGTGNTAIQWGKNAENAFSYHITVNAPNEGQVTTECVVCDIAGKSWSNYWIPNFATHFPQFAMRKDGNRYSWEFSLAVYNDTYDHNNPEASRAQLRVGKIMGLSLAYCENDDPNENPKKRDNFFGSVWVPEAAFNDHWMNADGFGTVMLVSSSPVKIDKGTETPKLNFQLFPNPSHGYVQLLMNNSYTGDLKIKIFNILGQVVYARALAKRQYQIQKIFYLDALPNGIYFFVASIRGQCFIQKILNQRSHNGIYFSPLHEH